MKERASIQTEQFFNIRVHEEKKTSPNSTKRVIVPIICETDELAKEIFLNFKKLMPFGCLSSYFSENGQEFNSR